MIFTSHSPHLLIDLSEEARWYECLDYSIRLSVRECKQIASLHSLHHPVNL